MEVFALKYINIPAANMSWLDQFLLAVVIVIFGVSLFVAAPHGSVAHFHPRQRLSFS